MGETFQSDLLVTTLPRGNAVVDAPASGKSQTLDLYFVGRNV
ncbi:MAG: hypothetical protein ACHQQQ_05580 [Bacteroidota bacterium]